MNKKICMVVQNPLVKGGIAAVVNGYRGSQLEKDFDIIYVESYTDGNKLIKLFKGICAYFCFAKVLMIDKPDLIHIHSSFGISFYRKLLDKKLFRIFLQLDLFLDRQYKFRLHVYLAK